MWPVAKTQWNRYVCHLYVNIYSTQVIFVYVFLIYNSDLEELSLRVLEQDNIVESICCG